MSDEAKPEPSRDSSGLGTAAAAAEPSANSNSDQKTGSGDGSARKVPSTYLDELPYYDNYKYSDNEIPLSKYLLPSDQEGEVQRGIESGRYPTLCNLARLQRLRGEGPRSRDAVEVPPPFPPRRTKAELFRPEEFAVKDEFVKSVTPRPAEDWQQLGQRLFKLCTSNLCKVRAAFCFVCTEWQRLAETEGETAAFRDIRLRSADDIFENLLTAGGVPHRKIYGYKKAKGYESGLLVGMNGHWFACYVEGEWRFVDPHWGSVAVTNYDSGTYGDIDDKGRVGSARERSGQNVFQCDEFWFLTDPDQLIASHCPPEGLLEWQLLARPVSIEEYQLMPRYFQGCMKEMQYYRLDPVNYPRNVIVARPGPVELLFKEQDTGTHYRYERQLRIHKKDISSETKAAILTAYQQKACVSKEIRVTEDTVKFIFDPPCPGQFALAIMLWREDGVVLRGSTFITYTVHCPQTWDSQVFPEGQLDEFGAGRDLRTAGLRSDAPGELKAADGEAGLEVAPLGDAESGPRNLTCEALGPDNKPLPAGSVLVWRDEQRNAFLFLAPDSGYYALVLYESGRPVGQFLVDASSEAKDGGSFPLPDWGRVGGLGIADVAAATASATGGARLVPLSHRTPYVRTEEAELTLSFGVEGGGSGGGGGVELKAELFTVGQDGEAEAAGDFVLVSGVGDGGGNGDGSGGANGGGYEVRCRFPRAGHYLLRLATREGGEGGGWRPYYTYFLRAIGQLDGSADAFPGLTPAWQSAGGALLEPLARTLPLDRPTPLRLRLADPAVDGVAAVDDRTGRREPLARDPADPRLWVGSVSGGKGDDGGVGDSGGGGRGVTVVARAEEGGAETELVKFDFESESGAEAKAAALREAEELNERRRLAEATRQRKQENRRRREQGLEPLKDPAVAEAEAAAAAKAAAEAEAAAAEAQAAKAAKAASEAEAAAKAAAEAEAAAAAKAAAEAEAAAKAAAEAEAAAAAKAAAEAEAAAAAKVAAEAEAAKAAEKAAAKAEADAAAQAAADAKDEVKLLIAQLDAALLERNLARAQKAIESLEGLESEQLRGRDAKKFEEAKLTLKALQYRKSLRDALSDAKKTGKTQRLRALVNRLEDEELTEAQLAIFKEDLRLAREAIERDNRLRRIPQHKMDISPSSLSELRQYSRPVETVHKTVQALLLLLGNYEKRTRKWPRCQPLLRSINKSVADFRPGLVDPRIAARSRQILDGIDKREIALQSAAAFAFYEWAVKTTGSIKEAASDETFVPASVKQQKRILGVNEEEDAKWDFDDEGIRRKF